MDQRPFNNTMVQYSQSDQTDSNCGDITFVNNGTANVVINGGLTLLPNQSFTFGANFGEINKTQFRFVFAVDPAGLVNLLSVIKKYFI